MQPEQFLRQFGTHLGLPALALNDRQVCRVVLDGRHAVDLEYSAPDDALHIYCAVGSIPRDATGPTHWAELLLAANMFGHQTGRSALALDSQRGQIFLCRTFGLRDMVFQAFIEEFDRFAGAALHWAKRLEEPLQGDTAPEPGHADSIEEHFARGAFLV